MDWLKKSENLQITIEKDCINIDKNTQATQNNSDFNLNILDLPSWLCLFLEFVF